MASATLSGTARHLGMNNRHRRLPIYRCQPLKRPLTSLERRHRYETRPPVIWRNRSVPLGGHPARHNVNQASYTRPSKHLIESETTYAVPGDFRQPGPGMGKSELSCRFIAFQWICPCGLDDAVDKDQFDCPVTPYPWRNTVRCGRMDALGPPWRSGD